MFLKIFCITDVLLSTILLVSSQHQKDDCVVPVSPIGKCSQDIYSNYKNGTFIANDSSYSYGDQCSPVSLFWDAPQDNMTILFLNHFLKPYSLCLKPVGCTKAYRLVHAWRNHVFAFCFLCILTKIRFREEIFSRLIPVSYLYKQWKSPLVWEDERSSDIQKVLPLRNQQKWTSDLSSAQRSEKFSSSVNFKKIRLTAKLLLRWQVMHRKTNNLLGAKSDLEQKKFRRDGNTTSWRNDVLQTASFFVNSISFESKSSLSRVVLYAHRSI